VAIHPKDIGSDNPRIQCACCAKWKRLHGRDPVTGEAIQRFFGGCSHNKGGDHLAAKTVDTNDVCANCCDTKCKEIADGNAAPRSSA